MPRKLHDILDDLPFDYLPPGLDYLRPGRLLPGPAPIDFLGILINLMLYRYHEARCYP